MMHPQNIPALSGPVVCVDEVKARANIDRMLIRANKSDAILRPHFKTHQSAEVAGWYRDAGIHRCTVSSPQMAVYFADHGWTDILIALPAQPGAVGIYNRLARDIHLGLIGDSPQLVKILNDSINHPIDFWIEIDAGYGRTGVVWDDENITDLAAMVEGTDRLSLRGLLCHAGESYQCSSSDEIHRVQQVTAERMQAATEQIRTRIGRHIELSYGDTPTCSVCDDLSAYDELRPGNFIYYDLMQLEIGACAWSDIAFTVACPVIGIYRERGELVIHGGAVHFSKEISKAGHYGQIVEMNGEGGLKIVDGAGLTGLSQEHGAIAAPQAWIDNKRIGDVISIVPVHSCLAADCLR